MQIKNSSLYSRFFKVVYTCIFCLTMLFSVFLFSLNASAADNTPNTEATTSADTKSNDSSVSENIYYTNPETGEDVLYTGKYEDSPYKLSWKGNYSGIDEAATEYFARKINGEKWEECAYNSSTDALQKITESMTKYAGINGEELLMQTYTGEDKDLFKNVYNKISGSNGAYDALNAMMRDSNTGNKMGGSQALYYETRFFEIDCQNAK